MTRALKSLAAVAVVVGLIVVVFAAVSRDDRPVPDDSGSGGPASPQAERTVPPAPADMPAEGMYVDSRVTDEGLVEVQTWIRTDEPITELAVTTTDPDLAPGSVESLDVVVRSMDGRMLAHRDSVGTNPQTLRLRRPATELWFSYTVDGGMASASATVEGRSLARVLGMDVDHAGAAGVVRRVVHGPGTVLNVACLRRTDDFSASPRPCGGPTDDGGWAVDLEGADRGDRLLASLED